MSALSSTSSTTRIATSSSSSLLCLTCCAIAIISILPSSEAFSPTAKSTCPITSSSTSIREQWASARQQQQQTKTNGRYGIRGSSCSSSQRYSIFYDDFEDFGFQQDDNSNNSNDDKAQENVSKDVIGNNNNNNNNNDGDLFASLKARQSTLEIEKQRIEIQQSQILEEERVEKERLQYNWNEANCLSTVRLTLNDYVRRIAIDLYPLVVCGSARGNLYLGDLEDGEEIDCIENVHASGMDGAELLSSLDTPIPYGLSNCLQALYDGHDGNGPLAIAIKKDLVVSSGREGGIHACTVIGKEVEVPNNTGRRTTTTKQTKLKLQREGKFRGLVEEGSSDNNNNADDDDDNDDDTKTTKSTRSPPPLITSLVFDDRGTLWAGGYDGILRGYHHEEFDLDNRPLMLRQKHPDYVIDVGSPILDMSVDDETGIIVVTTETDGVFLYSLEGSGRVLLHVNPFALGRRARSSTYASRTTTSSSDDDDVDSKVVSSQQNQNQSKQFCRTAMIVRNNNSTTNTNTIINEMTDEDEDEDEIIGATKFTTQTLIIGGSFGHLYQFIIRLYDGSDDNSDIRTTSDNTVSMVSAESMQKIRPKHMGPIVSLASPSPGLFITASHDGTIRVWDCSNNNISSRVEKKKKKDDDDVDDDDDDDEEDVVASTDKDKDDDDDDDDDSLSSSSSRSSSKRSTKTTTTKKKTKIPKVLYALSGYKVWLGSICANGRKLVSDGADNTIIVHSFDEDEEEILRSQQEDDEDDTAGEDPFNTFS
jgi:hypothetical protein